LPARPCSLARCLHRSPGNSGASAPPAGMYVSWSKISTYPTSSSPSTRPLGLAPDPRSHGGTALLAGQAGGARHAVPGREQVPCQATSVSVRPPDGGRQQTRFRGDRSSDAGPLGSGGGDGGPAMWTRTRVDFGQRTEKLVLVRHPNVLARSGPIYRPRSG
jgi:hypothetical protein